MDFFYLFLYILTANGFVPGDSGGTIRHNTQNNANTQTRFSIQDYKTNKAHTHNKNTNI
jgi:hypothetical protein